MKSKKRNILGILSILFVLNGCGTGGNQVVITNQPEKLREEIQNECGIDDRYFELIDDPRLEGLKIDYSTYGHLSHSGWKKNFSYPQDLITKEDWTYEDVLEHFPYHDEYIPTKIYCDYDEDGEPKRIMYLFHQKYIYEIRRRGYGTAEQRLLFEKNWWGIEQMISEGLKSFTGLEKEFEIVDYLLAEESDRYYHYLTMKYTGEIPFYVPIYFSMTETEEEGKVRISWMHKFAYANTTAQKHGIDAEAYYLNGDIIEALYKYIYQDEYQKILDWAHENDLHLFGENDEESIYMISNNINYSMEAISEKGLELITSYQLLEWYRMIDRGEEVNIAEIKEVFENPEKWGKLSGESLLTFYYDNETEFFMTKEQYLELKRELEELITLPGWYEFMVYPAYIADRGEGAWSFEGSYRPNNQMMGSGDENAAFKILEDGSIYYYGQGGDK